MYKRIIVKVGTSVLTSGSQRLDRSHMVELVRQSAVLHREGTDVIICSSGAIAAGREKLGMFNPATSIAEKQMLAAVGQSTLIRTWESLFDLFDIRVGQVLMTRSDVSHRLSYLNAKDTLLSLLEHRIVPIVNENDAVATAEIRVGDNDNLSALVGLVAEVNLLLLLTDQAGLFTSDPTQDPAAELIPEVQAIDDTLRKMAGASISGQGVGGMMTKLEAADTARRAGADVIIASGHVPEVIIRAVRGEPVGTLFRAMESPLEQRKKRILAGAPPQGRISVDEGAARALIRDGSSLLPAGISNVEGGFERGDPVSILDSGQQEIAIGISRYSSEETRRIAGSHSNSIQDTLGYGYGPVVVHRNDMIVL
ncbi:MAG: glutamate 5-kinase [Rhodothermales bacterium]|nr:glutamate 5-kinase [Rhodothermales bacterium]